MTPQDLSTWRQTLGLSQQEAADLLECSSRFIYMRWEKGQTEIPADLADRMAQAANTLAAAKANAPAQAFRRPASHTRRYLSLHGQRITYGELPRRVDECYYEYGWQNPRNGHYHFFLLQVGANWDGRIMGLGTPLNLDVTTWTVEAPFYRDHPAILPVQAKLQALLDANRANLPSLEAVMAATNAPLAASANLSGSQPGANMFERKDDA